jgi:cytochrome c oxidase cbb3-type subunit 2
VAAIARGKELFQANGCFACHGAEAGGTPGVAPNLVDDEFLGVKGDLPDAAYFAMIKGGSGMKKALGRPGVPAGGMVPFGAELSERDIWSIVAWLRNQKGHEAAEGPHDEKDEH